MTFLQSLVKLAWGMAQPSKFFKAHGVFQCEAIVLNYCIEDQVPLKYG